MLVGIAIVVPWAGGCANGSRVAPAGAVSQPVSSPPAATSASPAASVQPASYAQAATAGGRNASANRDVPPAPLPDGRFPPESIPAPADAPGVPAMAGDPLAAGGALSLPGLIAEVQACNPSVQVAMEMWRAASERYPQVVSLEDPMFGYMKGLNQGYMLEVSQKLPWFGKRALKGAAADAESNAAGHELANTRLELAEAATMAYLDYYQAARETEINAATEKLLKEFKETAQTAYEANRATQQDVYQAEVELAGLATRAAELRRMTAVASARINTLLHRRPDCPLPPPPAALPAVGPLPAACALRDAAVRQRPDLAAQLARVQAQEANLGSACKEYYPDLALVYRHDEFMPDSAMYNQVGMNVNVPLYQQKRHAAVREAQARVRQERAEYQRRVNEAALAVETAAQRVAEGRQVVALYETRVLPVVKANIEAARENYVAGKLDFLRLIEANRQLREQQERYYRAQAELHRGLAELGRAVGGPLPGGAP